MDINEVGSKVWSKLSTSPKKSLEPVITVRLAGLSMRSWTDAVAGGGRLVGQWGSMLSV